MRNNNKKYSSIIIGTSSITWGLISIETKLEYKHYLIEKYGNICENKRTGFGCGKKFDAALLEIDHIIPISMGGPVCDIGNMQLLCRECHKNKTSKIDNKLVEKRLVFKESKKFVYSC